MWQPLLNTSVYFSLRLVGSSGIRKVFLSEDKSLFSVSVFIQSLTFLSHSPKLTFVWSFNFGCIW